MKKHLLGLVLSLAALVPAAYADVPPPVTFTVTATADADGFGYTAGDVYTFVHTTSPVFTGNLATGFAQTGVNGWYQDHAGQDRMWATVGGSGLTGSYSDPQGDVNNPPNSYIQTYNLPDFNDLHLFVGTYSGAADIGLNSADGSTVLTQINTSIIPQDFSFSFTTGNPDPNAYFADYVGGYGVTGFVYLTSLSGDQIAFTPTSLTISTSSIPEPSTYATIFGAVALGFGVYRRRQARA